MAVFPVVSKMACKNTYIEKDKGKIVAVMLIVSKKELEVHRRQLSILAHCSLFTFIT